MMVIILSVWRTESECFGWLHAYSPLALFCTTRFNSGILCVLRPHLICVFCMGLRTFSDYFPVQNQLIDWSSARSLTLWKASVSFGMCVRPCACITSAPSRQIFVKFDRLFKSLSRKSRFVKIREECWALNVNAAARVIVVGDLKSP